MKRLASLKKEVYSVEAIAKRADNSGFYCVDSERRGLVYICTDEEMAIVTGSSGYLHMAEDDMKIVAGEILDILKDLEDRRRMQVG